MIRMFAPALLLSLPAISSTAAIAQTPPGATTQAQPFLATAGMSDVFEITTSQIALMKSRNSEVREFAQMMIAHHTDTTNGALAAAMRAGVMPPPPVLDERHRNLITMLMNAEGAEFDRLYWMQQMDAHEAALAVLRGYAANGDTAELRAAAAATAPLVQSHLERARMMRAAG